LAFPIWLDWESVGCIALSDWVKHLREEARTTPGGGLFIEAVVFDQRGVPKAVPTASRGGPDKYEQEYYRRPKGPSRTSSPIHCISGNRHRHSISQYDSRSKGRLVSGGGGQEKYSVRLDYRSCAQEKSHLAIWGQMPHFALSRIGTYLSLSRLASGALCIDVQTGYTRTLLSAIVRKLFSPASEKTHHWRVGISPTRCALGRFALFPDDLVRKSAENDPRSLSEVELVRLFRDFWEKLGHHASMGGKAKPSSPNDTKQAARIAREYKRHGTIRAAAEALGIPKSTFSDLCKRYGITTSRA